MKSTIAPSPFSSCNKPGLARPHQNQQPRAERAMRYYVLIPCADEPHQVELLERFLREGLPCKALLG